MRDLFANSILNTKFNLKLRTIKTSFGDGTLFNNCMKYGTTHKIYLTGKE